MVDLMASTHMPILAGSELESSDSFTHAGMLPLANHV